MQNEPTNYEQAMRELEDIVARVENNEMSIDDLTAQLNRAQTLIKFCRNRLLKTENEVKKILASDQQVSEVSTLEKNEQEQINTNDSEFSLPF